MANKKTELPEKAPKNDYNTYYIDGKLYVSVTTILSMEGGGFLIPWALKTFGGEPEPLQAYRDFMRYTQETGTTVHSAVENILNNNMDKAAEYIDDNTKGAINAFLTYLDQNEIEPIATEIVCHHEGWRTAGSCDLIARVNGELYIIDIKTGSVQAKAFTQLAAYKAFLTGPSMKHKIIGLDKAKLAVLNLHRDGSEAKFVTLEDFSKGKLTEQDEIGNFHALRYLWAMRNAKSKKFEPVVKNMGDVISPLKEEFKQFINSHF